VDDRGGDDEEMKVVLTVWWTWDGDGFNGEDGVEGVGCGGCVAAVCAGQRFRRKWEWRQK
nr:hypothetical protein [Tanacetum cinerariifolium]